MRVGGELNPTHHPSAAEHVLAAGIATLILEQHSRMPEANFLAVGFASLVLFGLSIAYGLLPVSYPLLDASDHLSRVQAVLCCICLQKNRN